MELPLKNKNYISAYQNIKVLLDSSKDKKEDVRVGLKQLHELEKTALDYQRDSVDKFDLNVSEEALAEAREKFLPLSQLIVHGRRVYDHACDEFETLMHFYAAQKHLGQGSVTDKRQKKHNIENVLNRVKDENDKTSRRYRKAESDYKNLLDIERKWKKDVEKNGQAKELDLMDKRDAIIDEKKYKSLKRFISEELQSYPSETNPEARGELEELLFTERKYFTLHPDEEIEQGENYSPEVMRRSLRQKKGNNNRTPYRGKLVRRPSQVSLDKEESTIEGDRVMVSKERLKALEEREEMYKTQIEELTTRLSSFASKQLLDGNPNIADLSDVNRPTKISEKFNNVYDNEWSDAYEELENNGKEPEAIIADLFEIITHAYSFTKSVRDQQIHVMQDSIIDSMCHIRWHQGVEQYSVNEKTKDPPPTCFSAILKQAKELRKTCALASVPSLCVIFKEICLRKEHKPDGGETTDLEHYADKVVEFMWLMVVQDPPMRIHWQEEGDKVDKHTFKYFERKGDKVHQTVWPAVFLHQKGPLVSKGFVLPKKKSKD